MNAYALHTYKIYLQRAAPTQFWFMIDSKSPQCVWHGGVGEKPRRARGMIKIGVDPFWNRAHKCKRQMLITRLGIRADAKC